jgi:P-type E1-E2 ATPase
MFGEGEDEGGEELGNVQVHPGKGIEGTIQDRRHYLIGSARLLQNVPMTAELQGHLADLEQCGMLCVLVACNGQLVAYFALSDEFKDDAVASVRTLRNEGYGVEMLTGDQWTAARWIAEPLGIRQVYANCSPSAKQHLISRRQCDNASLQHSTTKTNVIVFVGDGINDGPALAQADLGIALGRETSAVAQSAAHVVCLGAPVSQIRAVLHLGCAIRRTIAMSFGWSLGYNALALPLAAGLFYPWRIGPTLSGLLMSLSSVSVVLNALTLNLWYPPPDPNINQADADKRVHDEAERESLV